MNRLTASVRWRLDPPVRAGARLVGSVPIRRLPVFAWRFGLVERLVPCAHGLDELLEVARAVLDRRELSGDVAEFGCYRGGSTARLSLACHEVRKRLLVFDSFEGLPEPEPWDAQHRIARERVFERGEYAATLSEVQENVRRAGRLEVCEFAPGWFDRTLAGTNLPPLAVALLDVDLVVSTRQALDAAWSAMAPGGVVFVHDTADPKLSAFLDDWATGLEARPTHMRLPHPFARFEK
jgi:O-methyltransferase